MMCRRSRRQIWGLGGCQANAVTLHTRVPLDQFILYLTITNRTVSLPSGVDIRTT